MRYEMSRQSQGNGQIFSRCAQNDQENRRFGIRWNVFFYGYK